MLRSSKNLLTLSKVSFPILIGKIFILSNKLQKININNISEEDKKEIEELNGEIDAVTDEIIKLIDDKKEPIKNMYDSLGKISQLVQKIEKIKFKKEENNNIEKQENKKIEDIDIEPEKSFILQNLDNLEDKIKKIDQEIDLKNNSFLGRFRNSKRIKELENEKQELLDKNKEILLKYIDEKSNKISNNPEIKEKLSQFYDQNFKEKFEVEEKDEKKTIDQKKEQENE